MENILMTPEKEHSVHREFLEELNPLVHDPVRLALLSLLLAPKELPFRTIQEILGVGFGELNKHILKLSEASYLKISKTYVDTRPRRIITITSKGEKAVQAYANRVTKVIEEIIPANEEKENLRNKKDNTTDYVVIFNY